MDKATRQLFSQLLDTSTMKTQYPMWLCDLLEEAAMKIKDDAEYIQDLKYER